MEKLSLWEKIEINNHKKATHIKRNIFGNIVFVTRYDSGVEDEMLTTQNDDLFRFIDSGGEYTIEKLNSYEFENN